MVAVIFLRLQIGGFHAFPSHVYVIVRSSLRGIVTASFVPTIFLSSAGLTSYPVGAEVHDKFTAVMASARCRFVVHQAEVPGEVFSQTCSWLSSR